ncbi:MAG: hypothetical protein AAGC66_03705 [Leifsonia sp.]
MGRPGAVEPVGPARGVDHPVVSLILFFITGYAWGYQYSWLWFLLIPLVGAIAYGTDGGRRR